MPHTNYALIKPAGSMMVVMDEPVILTGFPPLTSPASRMWESRRGMNNEHKFHREVEAVRNHSADTGGRNGPVEYAANSPRFRDCRDEADEITFAA